MARISTHLTDIDITEASNDNEFEVITVSFIWGYLKIERSKTYSKVTYHCEDWMQADDGVATVDYGMNSDGSIMISEACRGN